MLVLPLVHLSGTQNVKANDAQERRSFGTMQRMLWQRRLQAAGQAGKPSSPGAVPEAEVPMGELPKSWCHIQQGPDRPCTSTTSACLWDHPSSKPPHRLCAKMNSWGRKECVWSYPFLFFLSPSLPKQMYPFHSPYLQTFCCFEQFLYSEAASLNFA